MKERFKYVDIMKGWAMFTIVLFHANNCTIGDFASQMMGNPWNVPIFFILAGFFLNIDKMKHPFSFMLHKLKGLYIPATIIYLMAVLCHNLFVDWGWYPLGHLHPGNSQPFSYYGYIEIIVGCVKALFCAGSGELVMGAMWFLYTLIYAFGIMSVAVWTIRKFSGKTAGGGILPIIFLVMGVLSCILSQKLNITINRVNVAFTAILLIYEGFVINQKLKLKYNNKWMLTICVIIVIHSIIMQYVRITMAKNCYQDLFQLCIGSASVLYVWGYIAKKIENTFVGNVLALIGKESLYIMSLHIMGFFICSSLLWKLGILSIDSPHGMYTYNQTGNFWQLAIYVVFGITFPLVIVGIFRKLKLKFSKIQK